MPVVSACTLCLEDIVDGDLIVVEGCFRHISCHKEYEEMIVDLEKIYNETCDQDI